MNTRKKLIEVALPLEAINRESAREKSIRHGHPSTLHLWWARRPLAACRAVIFASIVDDPSSDPKKFPTEEAQDAERQRLFRVIEELVKWDNSNNEQVLSAARAEIMKATNGNPPPVLDPFCGGGSIPLEAQRLGLEAHASDLNPVAVLITKALVEIPPKFAGRPPVNSEAQRNLAHSGAWRGVHGLAEDVRYYGKWMRDEAERRIGHIYPRVKVPDGREATVIAWLWARTVKCPNPACGAMMPLMRSFVLSTKKGKEAWVHADVDPRTKVIRFEIRLGKGSPLEGTVNRRGAHCMVCETSVPFAHVRAEAQGGNMKAQLLAIVAEGERNRLYVSPNNEHERAAAAAEPPSVPDTDLPDQALGFRVQRYGMTKHRDLFTARQLLVLTTLSDLVGEARNHIFRDARSTGMEDDGVLLDDGGSGATAYADGVATYLAFAVDKAIDRNTTLCTWETGMDRMRGTFGRQALPMVWDFAETNPFAGAAGDLGGTVESLCEVLDALRSSKQSIVEQLDATASVNFGGHPMVCTDPPYYDNIGYADLSDFFYIWLRRSLNRLYPSLFSTLLVPKAEELVATPFRFGGSRERAQRFFEEGLGKAFEHMREQQSIDFPLSVFYAFKQAESEDDAEESFATASTGWETMLEGLIRSGFMVTGTWPMRTELAKRSVGLGTNALASSIVLVCRPRAQAAPLATRREFLNALKRELPDALKNLQHGNIAPVDFAQAAIGPGMAVFSRYSKVVESDGSTMRVRTALQLINQALDEVLAEQESEYDGETRWAVAWFEQFGMNEGVYGTAETLSKAKNTSVSGMDEAGVTTSRAGKVRLLRRDELPSDWDPATDSRLTVWEVTQHLIRSLESGGEASSANLFKKVGGLAEIARDLAYRLYTTSERKGWTQEAIAYNSLVVAWPEIKRLAGLPEAPTNETLFDTVA